MCSSTLAATFFQSRQLDWVEDVSPLAHRREAKTSPTLIDPVPVDDSENLCYDGKLLDDWELTQTIECALRDAKDELATIRFLHCNFGTGLTCTYAFFFFFSWLCRFSLNLTSCVTYFWFILSDFLDRKVTLLLFYFAFSCTAEMDADLWGSFLYIT